MPLLFTEELLRQASDILERHHRAVAAAIYGEDALSAVDWKLAITLGLVDPKATGDTLNGQLYRFATILAHMDQGKRQSRYGKTAAAWLDEIRRNPVPMTATEEKSAKYAKHKAAQFVVGLGRKTTASLGTTLITEDAHLSAKFRSTIRDVISAHFGDNAAQDKLKDLGVSRGLPDTFFDNAFRGTTKRIRSDLGHATQEWARDLERIARTEAVEMWNNGQADTWTSEAQEEAKEDKKPQKVIRAYRVPRPAACADCRRLYRAGGEIRIFALADLIGNGNNYRLKRAEWKPIVGATHPYCVCDLQRLPTYIKMPKGWKSGDTAPTVLDSDGFIVLPEDDE